MSYIQDSHKHNGCVFCSAVDSTDGLENLVVYRGKYAFVILNRYPYTSGHLMVVPIEHKPNLNDLTSEARTEMIELISCCTQILRQGYHAQGFNIGANIGSAAGAGIPKHFHFHIVPRWEGDTNFLSSIGGTRLVPEALEETYQRVQNAWAKCLHERENK